MNDRGGELAGFAYGEDWDALAQRSLGYRLLAPAEPEPWGPEVEGLARRLQASPYSDHWPATDLFCSLLLGDGRRLVALARYGLADHTPSQRRGGLELVGVVGPPGLDVPSSLSIYRWLRKRREEVEDLHSLGESTHLANIPDEPPPETPADPLPVLPVRLWQDGALLFAASTPSEPDHRLRLLEQGAGTGWQWLPLVGPDFPLGRYAQRGPLVAWTPHLAAVALRVDRKSVESPTVRPTRGSLSAVILRAIPLLLLIGLLAENLWSLRSIQYWVAVIDRRPGVAIPAAEREAPPPSTPGSSQEGKGGDASRVRFVAALHQLLADSEGGREWDAAQSRLLARYQLLVRTRKELRVAEDDSRGKSTVAAISVLAGRSADRVEELVRKALTNKGFSDRLIDAACEHVRVQLRTDAESLPAP